MTTDVVSSNHTQSDVYNIMWYILSDRWFSPATPVSSTNKTDHHDITEILLKVALNTIRPNLDQLIYGFLITTLIYYNFSFKVVLVFVRPTKM